MSHENLTTIGAALQAEYQAWLAQSIIAWPEQFRQVNDDWDVLRRLNAELTEILRPIQECIEMDSWLTSGFFALPTASPIPEAIPENGLPAALLPPNPVALPGMTPTSPSQMMQASATSADLGRYTQEKGGDTRPKATPTTVTNPVKAAGGGLRDLARLAQASAVSDRLPVDSEQSPDNGQSDAANIMTVNTEQLSISQPSYSTEELDTPKLPTNFFSDIPEADFEKYESDPAANTGAVSSRIQKTTGLSPSSKAVAPKIMANAESSNPATSQPHATPTPSFEHDEIEALMPAQLLRFTDIPEADFDEREDHLPSRTQKTTGLPERGKPVTPETTTNTESSSHPTSQPPVTPTPSLDQAGSENLTPAHLLRFTDIPEADFGEREGHPPSHTQKTTALPERGKPVVPRTMANAESSSHPTNQPPVAPAPSFEQDEAESLTPAILLRLTHQLAQDAGEEAVAAATVGAFGNPPPADVDLATAAQMPIDFQRVLMALPFGDSTQRAGLLETSSRRSSANVAGGQAAARNRSTATGRNDAPPTQPEAEPTLVVERRTQAAKNTPPSLNNSEIDLHDLMDTLSQEIWREYQRYYGR